MRKSAVVVSIAALCAVLLAACGGGSDSGTTTKTATVPSGKLGSAAVRALVVDVENATSSHATISDDVNAQGEGHRWFPSLPATQRARSTQSYGQVVSEMHATRYLTWKGQVAGKPAEFGFVVAMGCDDTSCDGQGQATTDIPAGLDVSFEPVHGTQYLPSAPARATGAVKVVVRPAA